MPWSNIRLINLDNYEDYLEFTNITFAGNTQRGIRTFNAQSFQDQSLGFNGVLTREQFEEFRSNLTAEQINKVQQASFSNQEFYSLVREYLVKTKETRKKELDESIITDPDTISDVVRGQLQCVLVENIPQIVPSNYKTYYNNFTMLHDKSDTIVSRVIGMPNLEPFWSVTPEQFARFQPQIRIFKSYYGEDKKITETIEMPFEEYMSEDNLANLTESSISRGTGVGLVSVDWKLAGSNPAESKNVIETTLKFRFDSLQEIARERIVSSDNGKKSKKISFLDFFTLPKGGIDPCESDEVYDPNYFEFKMLVGWNNLTNMFEPARRKEEKSLTKCVQQDRKLYVLTMTNHNLEVTQEGPVILTLHAIARLDSISYTEQSNIFKQFLDDSQYTTIQDVLDRKNREVACKESPTKAYLDDSNKVIEAYTRALNEQKTLIWSGFIKKLSVTNKMWAIQVTKEDLGIVRNSKGEIGIIDPQSSVGARRPRPTIKGPINYEGQSTFSVPTGGDIQKSIDASREAANKDVLKRATGQGEIDSVTTPFMFLGDILDVALNALSPKYNQYLQEDNHKIFVGDIVYYDPVDKKKYSVNIADIPISFDLFKDWFINNVYATQRVFYPVKEFITDFIESVVYEMFKPNTCFVNVPSRRMKVSYSGFTFPSHDGKDPLNPMSKLRMRVDEVEENKKRSMDLSKDGKNKSYYEYLMIYGSDIEPTNMKADHEEDIKHGIPWMHIGRDRGLVRNIKFKRSDLPFVREARISQGDTELAKLRERYTATIEMIGNNVFYPGQFVFINPSTVTLGSVTSAQALARTIGLVGYYQIINVENTISAGKFDTTIDALWTHGGYDDKKSANREYRTYDLVILDPMGTSLASATKLYEGVVESTSNVLESAKKISAPLADKFGLSSINFESPITVDQGPQRGGNFGDNDFD